MIRLMLVVQPDKGFQLMRLAEFLSVSEETEQELLSVLNKS